MKTPNKKKYTTHTIYIPIEMSEHIDMIRGDVSRNKFICKMLERGMNKRGRPKMIECCRF